MAASTSKPVDMPATARQGRVNQRYSAAGERLVAGIVALSADKTKVLLIQSQRRQGWVLPKGGWETDEPTAEAAAKREAWEEAGITCTIINPLGTIVDKRPPKEYSKHAPKALYHFFEAKVDEEKADWPEKHKRNRKWMTYKEALEALKARDELSEALTRSGIAK